MNLFIQQYLRPTTTRGKGLAHRKARPSIDVSSNIDLGLLAWLPLAQLRRARLKRSVFRHLPFSSVASLLTSKGIITMARPVRVVAV